MPNLLGGTAREPDRNWQSHSTDAEVLELRRIAPAWPVQISRYGDLRSGAWNNQPVQPMYPSTRSGIDDLQA